MTQPNLVSVNIPEEELKEIKGLIDQVKTKLTPYLVRLSPEEKNEMLKMGDKTLAFVQKTLEYCQRTPALVPSFLNVSELATDVRAMVVIHEMYRPLLEVTDALSDTMSLAGCEAFTASLIYYSSIKIAMKSNDLESATIYSELSARFPGRPKKINPVTNV